MDEFDFKDYLSIFKRRKNYFFIVFALAFLCSLIFAYHWSNYRATATVEVAPSEISASTAMPAGMNASEYNESLADLHISHLQQKVLSTGSLIELITKFNLYSDARKITPIATIANNMAKKIRLELVSSQLANASTAQKASASELSAIAFTLSFDYNNPLIAQQVTNELVSRFLDEDLKYRRNAAHETSVFIDAQIKVLEASMDEQEKKIANFRAANGGVQPESLAFNQQAAESMLMNIQSIDAQLAANEGTQGSLRAQIATTDPYSRLIADGQVLTTPSVQLKALKSQYATLSAQYGPEHPDVIKVANQIAALEKHTGTQGDDTGALRSKIRDVETNLTAAQKTYGPDHPDVIALKQQLMRLKEQLASVKTVSARDNLKQDADNPAYLQVVEELKSAEEQNKALIAQKNSLIAQQEKYQTAVTANPLAEQKLSALTRDYENSQMRFRELKEKKMAADMSEAIEQDRSGQRLLMLDPPELPLQTQPARKLFALGGLLLALVAGLTTVVFIQVISQSVVGPHHLEALVGVAPLVTIPHIMTFAEKNSIKRQRVQKGVIALAAVVIGAIIFSYAVMPLDVLWTIIGQKLGLA